MSNVRMCVIAVTFVLSLLVCASLGLGLMQLESNRGSQASSPKYRDDYRKSMVLARATAEQLLAEASSNEANRRPESITLLIEARERLRPYLRPRLEELDMWLLAGRVASKLEDRDLAPYVFEAVDRLDSKWDENPSTLAIMASLDRLGASKSSDVVRQQRYQVLEWIDLQLVDIGDAEAHFELGRAYYAGHGVVPNPELGFSFFWSSATYGNPQGMTSLGHCYRFGWETERDLEEALSWYSKAAEREHPRAMFELATCYFDGVGTERNDKEAIRWCQEAALNGNAQAMVTLGACYQNGEHGLDQDLERAVQLYEDAAEQGDALGMAFVAESYVNVDFESLNSNPTLAYGPSVVRRAWRSTLPRVFGAQR